jgi:hypothetical protein
MKRQAKPLDEIAMDNGENEMSDLLTRQMTQLTVSNYYYVNKYTQTHVICSQIPQNCHVSTFQMAADRIASMKRMCVKRYCHLYLKFIFVLFLRRNTQQMPTHQ